MPEKKKKPGPPSLAEQSGEETVMFSLMLLRSQYDYIMNQEISAAQYVRYLIEISRIYMDLLTGKKPEGSNLDPRFIEGLVSTNEIFRKWATKYLETLIGKPDEEPEA